LTACFGFEEKKGKGKGEEGKTERNRRKKKEAKKNTFLPIVDAFSWKIATGCKRKIKCTN